MQLANIIKCNRPLNAIDINPCGVRTYGPIRPLNPYCIRTYDNRLNPYVARTYNIYTYIDILNKIKCNRITDCIYYYLKSPNCRGEFISRNIAIGNAIKPRIAMMKKLLI